MAHRSTTELEAGLDHIRSAPSDNGVLALIVRRPAVDVREVLEEGFIDLEHGLIGDTWRARAGSANAHPYPDRQLTVMSARAIALVAGEQERWPLAGDQLYVDLDLSKANVPPGTRLAVGQAVIEVTEPPHTGCQKFSGLRSRRVADRQFSGGARATAARHQRPGGATGND